MSYSSPEHEEIGRFVRAHRIDFPAPAAKSSGKRRVAHLTQTELAQLAGVSTVVISQIEQGRYLNLNQAILRRVASALELPAQNETYLLGLQKKRTEIQRGRERTPAWLSESVNEYEHPAMVVNPAYDVMASNTATEKMMGSYAHLFKNASNAALAIYRVPEMRNYFVDWERFASGIVSGMRMGYGVHADFRNHITSIANTLAAESQLFHSLWHQDNPLQEANIENELRHPELGLLSMILVTTVIVEAPHLTMIEILPADEESRTKLASISMD